MSTGSGVALHGVVTAKAMGETVLGGPAARALTSPMLVLYIGLQCCQYSSGDTGYQLIFRGLGDNSVRTSLRCGRVAFGASGNGVILVIGGSARTVAKSSKFWSLTVEWVITKCEVAAARLGIHLTPLRRSLNLMASELACWTEANGEPRCTPEVWIGTPVVVLSTPAGLRCQLPIGFRRLGAVG